MDTSDILRYIYTFLNYQDSKKILLNKEFKNILHEDVSRDYLAGKKMLAFMMKHNNVMTQAITTKRTFIRHMIRTLDDDMLINYNCYYFKVCHLLSAEQINEIIQIINSDYHCRRAFMNFANVLTYEQLVYIGM
jgi:hypothetical protein